VVGGHLFEQMWRRSPSAEVRPASMNTVVAAFDERVSALLARHPGKKAVLYTASGFEDDEHVRGIGAAIRATQADSHWYCRMHPVRMGDARRFQELLRESGARSFDVENATALPLYGLLRHMDLHVTEGSSTIIEATNFGVPSVLWGTLEVASYPAFISSGWLRAASQTELPEVMRQQVLARAGLTRESSEGEPVGLPELLALAQRR
jgi:hypothetical protein